MSSQTSTTVYINSLNKDESSSSITSSSAPSMPMGPNSFIHYAYATPANEPVSLSASNDLKYHNSRIESGMPYPSFGGPGGSAAAILEFGPGSHFPLHRTNTLDCLFIMEGEIELTAADGNMKVIKKGDIIIQRGAWHEWKNPSETEAVRIAVVNMGCEGAEEGKMIWKDGGA